MERNLQMIMDKMDVPMLTVVVAPPKTDKTTVVQNKRIGWGEIGIQGRRS